MPGALPHFKTGPANYQVSTLIFGGQLVEPTTPGSTTDFTVKPAGAASVICLGVAGGDANVIATQTGSPNTYGQPLIDISVLSDYTAVYYGGIDIPVWYSATATQGQLLMVGANGTVVPFSGTTYSQIIGRCTQMGGVPTLNQAIGGLGAASFRYARMRFF